MLIQISVNSNRKKNKNNNQIIPYTYTLFDINKLSTLLLIRFLFCSVAWSTGHIRDY